MSLDVYLDMPSDGAETKLPEGSGIFIRRDGSTVEISREEWDELYPDRDPCVVKPEARSRHVYSANITHNLNKMAGEAGIYEHLWRPDELGIKKAKELIEPLKTGLALLQSEPERFKAFNPSNGWGTYEGLCQFVADYLSACISCPEAEVSVWR